jgi:hypothetical protein
MRERKERENGRENFMEGILAGIWEILEFYLGIYELVFVLSIMNI